MKIEDFTFIIANFYRPPKGDVKVFNEFFPEFLNELNNLHLPAYDSNINLLKNDEQESDFFNNCLASGFINFINNATRVPPPSYTAIDQAFANAPDKVTLSGIITDSPSDHYFTFLLVSPKNRTMRIVSRL